MQLAFNISIAITVGIIVGGILAFLKTLLKKPYTDEQIKNSKNLISKISPFVTYTTILVLVIGLVWTIYFFILAIVDKTQAEYASNISELLVGVLTVFSIIIAFFEFMKNRK